MTLDSPGLIERLVITERYSCEGVTVDEIWTAMTEVEKDGLREEAERRYLRRLEELDAA